MVKSSIETYEDIQVTGSTRSGNSVECSWCLWKSIVSHQTENGSVSPTWNPSYTGAHHNEKKKVHLVV